MNIILSALLSTILLPAASVYNVYVQHTMERDVPKAISGPHVPIRESAKPIVMKAKSEKAVLMIHGFSGSPRDFGRLPKLFKAEGYDVFVPLLPAHGRGARALAHVNSEEWLEYVSATYEQVRSQYKEVVLIGLSMGASLNILVSVQSKNPPDKLILLAPFFRVKQHWYYLLPVETIHKILSFSVPYVKSFPGQSSVAKSSAHSKTFVKHQYLATRAAGEAFEIARAARSGISALSKLQIPMLVIQSRGDQITDYDATRRILRALKNKNARLVTLSKSNHVLPLDCEAALVQKVVMDFTASAPASA